MFKWFHLLSIINLHLMSSLIGIINVLYWLKIWTDNCALLVSIEVSRSSFHFSIRISVSLWIPFRIVFLFKFIRHGSCLFKAWSWFEILLFIVSLFESLICDLKLFASRVNILILNLSIVKGVNRLEVRFILKLSRSIWVSENTSSLSNRFSSFVSFVCVKRWIRILVLY